MLFWPVFSKRLAYGFGGSAVASLVGRCGHFNSSGGNQNSYQLLFSGGEWSGGTPQSGDLCLLVVQNNQATGDVTLPSGFTSACDSVPPVVDGEPGENYHLQFGKKVLDATNISNGYIQLVETIPNNRPAGLWVFRNATDIIQEEPNCFQRASSLNANSVSIARPTATSAGIAVSMTFRGGGTRTTTQPSGFTDQGDFQSGTGVSVYTMHFASKSVTGAGQIAAGTVSFSGAADMTITNVTLVIE